MKEKNGTEQKLKVYGFNNLTKSLSFNIYDVCYAKTPREQQDYLKYIHEQYNSERLTGILQSVTDKIGATVLNIAKQDYDPQGASVTILIADETRRSGNNGEQPDHETEITDGDLRSETVLGHLDKSHVTVHTYPEFHPDTSIATFRVDIDIATCGQITPLQTLDYLIGSFDSDIITMDYRVRGFTRDLSGKKLFNDHQITSIQDFIDDKVLDRYDAVDVNVYHSNIFHTKMLIKEIHLQNYLFNTDAYEVPPMSRLTISHNLRQEMIEIFSGKNIY
ncbi:MAG: adenosylmethionine decarboxylase [Defluviitaleaceae bacterium]|nr:adenosylmethionine decarboxylase [Defluviitaleaceae bacterium]